MNTIYRDAAGSPSPRELTPEDEMLLAFAKANKPGLKFGLVARGLLFGLCLVGFAIGERPYGWAFMDVVLIATYALELYNTRRMERGLPRLRLSPDLRERLAIFALCFGAVAASIALCIMSHE